MSTTMESTMAMNIAATLRRIRQVITDSVRSYESSRNIQLDSLLSAKINLRRLETSISPETMEKLNDAIDGLLQINNTTQGEEYYCAPRINLLGRGRPVVHISEAQLRIFYDEGFTATDIAKQLGCSKSKVYKTLYQLNMPLRGRYSTISNEELREKVEQIHLQHPGAGHVMMESYLKADKIIVPRQRIRETLNAVDPVGTANRWSKAIKRRVYTVPTPNALWHIDAHLKLSRWGFVIHGCVDGFSRMIVYLQCETSIQPEPVLNLFSTAIKDFGFPSRVRSDHGYENILVAVLMNLIRGLNRGSHITGKSTHNQRIERLWVDVIKEVCNSVRSELYHLEDQRQLDPENIIHKFCVQFVYKTVINRKLSTFQRAWNVHKISTEKNKSPRQLWLQGVLSNYNSGHLAITDIFNNNHNLNEQVTDALQNLGVDTNVINTNNLETSTSKFEAVLDLTDDQKLHLQNVLSQMKPDLQKYLDCVNYLIL